MRSDVFIAAVVVGCAVLLALVLTSCGGVGFTAGMMLEEIRMQREARAWHAEHELPPAALEALR